MSFSNAPRPPRWLWWGALLVAAFAVLPLVLERAALMLVADAVFLPVTGWAAARCAAAARRAGPVRPAWIAMAGAAASWFVAQLVYVPNHLGAAPNVWVDSIASVGSVLVAVFLFAGLVALAHARRSRYVRRETVLDASLGLLAAAAVAYELIFGPVRVGSADDRAVLGAIIGAQALGLLLTCAATVGMTWQAQILPDRAAVPLLGGLLAMVVGAAAYAATVLIATYYPGCPADVPHLAGFLLIGHAARQARGGETVEPRLIDARYLQWRSGLVASSALAVGGLATYAAVGESDPVITAGVVLSTLLLTVRIGLGASDHLRLDLRTRERDRLAAVIDLSAAIAGSLNPNEVLVRLAEAAARAAGRTYGRAVVIGPDGAVEVTAAVGDAGPRTPVSTDPGRAARTAELASLGAREVRWAEDPALPEALVQSKVASGMIVCALAPLVAGGTRLGYVEAWTPKATDRFAPEDLAAVAAIGQQGGLAVRNAGLHAELAQRAGTDELTGVLNRRALMATLTRELAAAREIGASIGVLMIDVDDFKSCNDTYGHAAGDRMLRELASVLGECLEPGDLAGRYGGDEFVVVLPGAGRADTERTAELIAERARRTTIVEDGAYLRLSIGTAIAPMDGTTADELIDVADRAMYAAKRFGRVAEPERLVVL